MKQYEEEFLDRFGYEGLKIIAACEGTMDLDYYDHYTRWFSNYNMHVFSGRKEVTFEQLRARYFQSLSLLGIKPEEARDACRRILTADMKTHIHNERLRMVKTNVGEMPLTDYRDLRAGELGYDSYTEMYAAGLRVGHGSDPISILQRLTPFRSVRDTFTVGEDIEQDSYSGQIKARLENLHGARREFGIHATAYELGQQKMYAGYFPRTDQVELSFQLSGEDYSQFYHCDLSGADAQLVKELLAETIREKYGQTPQEFIECDSDKGMIL